MTKTTLREIKSSLGRWIAIMAIVALGVGFFSGLKMCKDDFVKTGDTYVAAQNMYDMELMTTLGLEDADVDIIAGTQGVKTAEGTWSSDALVDGDEEEGGQHVATFYTLSDTINLPSLKAGTMPTQANQCLGDYRYFTEDDLGTTIRLADINDEDTLDLFAYKEYELVGLMDSPVYLNFERGSTSLGNGSVSFFAYLLPEGWDSDIYTSIYVDFADDYTLFSDEYDENADVMEDRLEDAMETVGERRYDAIIDEARDKLADAQAEVDDAQAELDEHRQELEDAKKKLADGQAEINTNRKKLTDSKADLADARKELDDARAELADARKTLDENKETLESSRKELAQARKDYEDGLASYEEQRDAAYHQLDAALAAGAMTQAQYDTAKAQADQQLAPAKAQLDAALEQLTAGEKELAVGEQKLADGEKDYAAGKKKYDDGEKEYQDGLAEIRDAEKKLADAQAEVNDGQKEVTDAEEKLADGEEKIADARKELHDAEKEIDDIEYPTTYVLGRETNIGYVCFENDSKIVDGIARVFPIFFFLVAALVCMTTMTRMIDEQRTQIGVLKALGYSRRQILKKYVIYAGSAALIGAVAGFLIGVHLFPFVIWAVYGMMYGFADIVYVLDWKLGVATLLVALLCCVGTTIYSCSAELKEVPAQLIRPKSPKAGKRILLERVPFIWDKLKFLIKVSIRNTFRYRRRFFMMVLGISGCTALLITGLGIKDSIANVVSAQYDDIYHVDYTVSFQKDMEEDEQSAFLEEAGDVISDCLFLYTSSVDARTDNTTKSINLVVCKEGDDTSSFIDLHNDDGPIAYPARGEGVINSNLADNMGLTVGDTISVYDSDMRKMTVTITALCDNYVYNYLYINDETYEENWGHLETNSAFVLGITDEEGELVDPHGDGAELMNARNVSAVNITMDFRDRIANMMESLNYIVALVVISAGALAFIVLYNLTNINITERIREIATIKVLGFYANETSAYVFRENLLLTAIASIVGLPLGAALHAFVMSQVKIDMLSFDIHIEPVSYVIGVVITFLFAFLVNLTMQRKLSKVSMTESLKSIE